MNRVYRFLAIIGLTLILLATATSLAYTNVVYQQPTTKVRNIIFLIGDGMGLSHIRLTQLAYGRLALEYFTDIGIVYTDSLSGEVTDSAAAGTALATGVKTENRVISMVPVNGKLVSVMTLLELAQKLGKSTGLITTTRITHATPAVFASHVPDREMEAEIAEQLIEHGVDVLMGGGLKYFPEDLLEKAREAGYTIIFNKTQLLELEDAKKVLGLFAESHIPYVLDRDETVPSLVDMVAKAIDILDDNPNGFFLMVEGGRIDHAAHSNDAPSVVAETKEFDEVVGLALNYALGRGDTLVIVVADHETGGLAVGGYGYGRVINFTLLLGVKASAIRMAKEIQGGADPKTVIQKYTGITITDEEAQEILSALQKHLYAGATKIGNIVSKYMGIAWASSKHTGQPVIVFAYGPGSNLFRGVLHLTDIAKIIATLMLFGTTKPLSTITLEPSPVPGDINGDGVVDSTDAYIVLTSFLGEKVDTLLEKHVDMNGNGVIDLEDVYILYTGNYGKPLTPTMFSSQLELAYLRR